MFIDLIGAIMESGTMLMMREDPKVSKTHRAAQGAAIYHNCPSTNYDDRQQVKILFRIYSVARYWLKCGFIGWFLVIFRWQLWMFIVNIDKLDKISKLYVLISKLKLTYYFDRNINSCI